MDMSGNEVATMRVRRMRLAESRYQNNDRENVSLEEAIMARDIALLLSVLVATRVPRKSIRKAA
jgi:hypothetical protein